MQAGVLQSLFGIEAPKGLLDERPNGSRAKQIRNFLFHMDKRSVGAEEPCELQRSCLETKATGRLCDHQSRIRQRFQETLRVYAQHLAKREYGLWTDDSDAGMD